MAAKPSNTKEYLAGLPREKRATLEQLRDLILSVAPKAEESFSYGIPELKLDGERFLWYAAWKHHYSLYPVTGATQRAYAAEISGYETAKGTIRFPASAPLPIGLLKKLVKSRVAEVRAQRK
jgi:uncharacterized protein YdhG (YjbR/CyaY superfamily)